MRISGPTRCCGVVTPSIRVPQSAKRIVGEFQCPICLSRFTRSEGVNFHFAACAEKHGNPHGHRWNDHLSCASRSSGQPGVAADPRHQVRPPAPKKRCIVSLSSGPSTATRSGNDEIAQTRPVSPPDALLTAPRATRSKPMQRASGTRPGPGLGISKTRSKETRGASRTSAARPKAGKEKNSNDNRKSKTPRKSVSGVGERTTVYRSHIDESLPPLSDLDAIFHDMVSKAWEKTPLAEAMKTLSEKKIHVATMCSGTESPLLALGKIQNSKHRSRPSI